MGCGESKQAVATENTITRKRSDAGSMKNKDIKTVDETSVKGNKTDSLMQREESQNVRKCSGDENAGPPPATDEYAELKEGEKQMNKEDGVAVEDQEEPAGRLISKGSPNRITSSRKDEDIEGFDSDAISDKSEYLSPRLESEKESLGRDCVKWDDAVEETSVQVTENGL